MRVPIGALAALSLLVGSVSAHAQGTATVAGRVTNAATGQPLSGVSVFANSASSGAFASTDASGNYAISISASLPYTLRTSNQQAFVNQAYGGEPCSVFGCAPTRSFTLAPGQTLQADFALEPGAQITGRITDAVTGAPLRFNVWLFDAQRRVINNFAMLPDANGVYLISAVPSGGLPAGTYFAAVFSSEFAGYVSQLHAGIPCVFECRLQDATPIRVAARQVVGGIDFALQPRRGVITGRVTNATSGQPVIGVQVHAEARTATFSLISATTDAAGGYRIENLSPASYSVYANTSAAPGYVAEIFSDIPNTCASNAFAPGCRGDIRTGTAVTVTGSATVSGIDFALSQGGAVRGTLTRGGQPLSVTDSGRVTLFDAMGRQAGLSFPTGNGGYTIDGVPPGTYFALAGEFGLQDARVYGAPACRQTSCVTAGTPIVVGTAPVTGIDFNLPARTGEISGEVRGAGGQPLVATVYLSVGDDPFPPRTTTAADGTFRFDRLAADTYRIRVEAPGHVGEWHGNACAPCGERGTAIVLGEGASIAGLNFALDPAGQITGQITVSGTLVNSIAVEALRADGSIVGTASSANQYTIEGLPAGTYFVRARDMVFTIKGFSFGGDYPSLLYNQVPCDGVECPLNGATPVTVTAGAATTGIDFSLEPGGTITGRVVGEGFRMLGDQFPGRPATSPATVRAYTADGREAGHRIFPSNFSVDDRFTIRGLRAGTYYLTASAQGYPTTIYKDLVCPACPPQRGTPVTVTAGQTRSGIDFLVLPGGSIAGTVTDGATGEPLAGVAVTATTAAGGVNVMLTQAGTATTTTDRLGGFLLENLGAGDYFIATSNAFGYADEVYDNVACGSCDPTRGRAVLVQSGATTGGINIALARGAVVSGLITDATGAVAGSVPVALFDSTGAKVARVTTSLDGVFVASVPAGNTFARAEPASPFSWRLYNNLACADGACDPRDGTPIAASAGARIQGINFTLPACGVTLIQTMLLPNGAVGAGYSATITATGAGPYSFRVVSGSLPPGVSLASTGSLAGTPTAPGRYSFTAAATNGSGCGTTRVFTLDVTACTPVLAATTVDIAGAGGTIQLGVAGACQGTIAINAPWIARGATVAGDPTTYEFTVAPNPGGRRTGSITFGNRVLTVNQAGATPQAPFGTIDTPFDGTVVSGSIAIGGWALDDLRVAKVDIIRGPVNGETGPVFIGTAVLVPGARPDVEGVFGDLPLANRAGWGYLLLTNMLPDQGNGAFQITAIAEDAEGHRTEIGTRTIIANNASATRPFGAIDTPAQGETISGTSYTNFGWALTPQPKTIPTDGSTIRVLIDGTDIGSVDYNHFRADVSGLFPGLNNSSGPVGFRSIDTTTLADGLHTIAWIVTDNAGSAEGIGSRYFTVQNGAAQFVSGVLAPPALRPAAVAAFSSARQVRVRELEPVAIDLSLEQTACAATYSGFEVVRGDLRTLPVGSRLDAATGRFAWQPGPGFFGAYRLVFFVSDCTGVRRVDVDVVIDRSQERRDF